MDKTLLVSCALLLGSLGAPAYSTELKPEITSEDVVIQNTVANSPIPVAPMTNIPVTPVTPVTAITNTIAVDAKPIVKSKDDTLKAAKERDDKLNKEYKDLKDKPNMFRHPVKRADLWIDYHPNQYRKFRTRVIPATQFAAIFVGMGFSIAGAL